MKDSEAYGWDSPNGKVAHKWDKMVKGIQNHIGGLNWGYKFQLQEKKVAKDF